MSTSTTSASPASAMRCAVVAPTLPAPMTVTSGWDMRGWAPAPGMVRPRRAGSGCHSIGAASVRPGATPSACAHGHHRQRGSRAFGVGTAAPTECAVEAPRARPRTIRTMSTHRDPDWRPGTLAVHAGQEPDAATGAVARHLPDEHVRPGRRGAAAGGWEYARTGNPTRQRLEDAVAALEGGDARTGLRERLCHRASHRRARRVQASGCSSAMTSTAAPIGCSSGCCASWASTRSGVDLSVDPAATLADRLTPDTRMVWLESPSNPLLKLVDIAAVAPAPHAHIGARGEAPIVVVDNTFASPLSQQPLRWARTSSTTAPPSTCRVTRTPSTASWPPRARTCSRA